MSPPIALKPNVAVGADEKKRVGDMRQVIARVGAWKLGSEGARYVGGEPAVQDVIAGTRLRSPPPAIRGSSGPSRARYPGRSAPDIYHHASLRDRTSSGRYFAHTHHRGSEDATNKPC